MHVILDLAEALKTDLLVLGSHGHSGLEWFLLGSVTVQLVRMAPCPVFTLKSFGKSLVAPLPKAVPIEQRASHHARLAEM